jgi:monoamine oxidase
MIRLNRRKFIGSATSAVVCPAVFARAATRADFDIIIIGAGAAGISAGRRLARSSKSFAIIEASDRLGGRCYTEAKSFGRPFDHGAACVHETKNFQVTRLATEVNFQTGTITPSERFDIGFVSDTQGGLKFRLAREPELEQFYAYLNQSKNSILEASQNKTEVSGVAALPKKLGSWRPTMEFMLGPYLFGGELNDLSAKEVAGREEPFQVESGLAEKSVRIERGIGALIGRLAVGLPIKFFSPVTRIKWDTDIIEIECLGTRLTARAVIVTASTEVLAKGKIEFKPALPSRYADAISTLKLGSFEKVAFDLGLLEAERDALLFEKAESSRTAAAHLNIFGSSISVVHLRGAIAAELSRYGEEAMKEFAIEWLVGHFGSQIKKQTRPMCATRWTTDPWSLGAASLPSAGSGSARDVLSQPIGNKVWLAGEAVHKSMWGTVAGAWESGLRAAETALQGAGGGSEHWDSNPRD